jgi:hypothetical protein
MLRGSLRRSASILACSLLSFVSVARAQTSETGGTPASTATFLVPEKMPAKAAAQGWSQEKWTEVRQYYRQCLNIPAETTRRAHLSPAQRQGLKPIPGDLEACKHSSSEFTDMVRASQSFPEGPPQSKLEERFARPGGPTSPLSGAALPTPIATPFAPAAP